MCEILNYEVWIVDAMAFYVFPCSVHWLHTMSTDTRIACLGDLLTGDQFGSSSGLSLKPRQIGNRNRNQLLDLDRKASQPLIVLVLYYTSDIAAVRAVSCTLDRTWIWRVFLGHAEP